MEWSEVQICGQIGFSVCAHSACKALIPLAPFGCCICQPVPSLTVGDRMIAGGCFVDTPNSFCSTEDVTAHSRGDALHGNTCKPLCDCGSRETRAAFVGSALSHKKCWTRRTVKELLRKSGNKSWAFGVCFRLSYWLWKRKTFEICVNYQTIIVDRQ